MFNAINDRSDKVIKDYKGKIDKAVEESLRKTKKMKNNNKLFWQ